MKNIKNTFQEIHYNRLKPSFLLRLGLSVGECFYKKVINFKNFLYDINFLKEEEINSKVICIGNLTTGGVGKTPIVINLANRLAKTKKVALIERGYGAKLQNKNPNIIKDYDEIKFKDGRICGDEPFQVASSVDKNVIVITCKDRKKACKLAIEKYKVNIIILDDGFSNRKIKKDETYVVIDSKMRFGNNHLLPYGPLREPISEIKRASKIILVNKGDEKIDEAYSWANNTFKQEVFVSNMYPKRIYNLQTKAQVLIRNEEKQSAIAFCAIGQPSQFFDFAKKFYDIKKTYAFSDHYKYTKNDINDLIKIAKENKTNVLITTQKDEAKLKELIKNIQDFSFNVLELDTKIEEN